jgi:MFS family permease
VGLSLLAALDEDFRTVFLIAAIPAVAGVALLAFVAERPPPVRDGERARVPLRELGAPFWVLLGVSLLFALGNSSDAFLILRSKDLGLSNTEVVGAYIAFNATYAVLAMPAGIASDRLGRRNVIGLGYGLFALVYLGFAVAGTGGLAWPLFAVYGFYMALTEGVARAFVADFVPAENRATALGIYTGALGAMILVSSVLAGLMWDHIGAAAPFYLGAATAATALVALVVLLPRRHEPPA